jgi:hypothetical protein
MTSFIEANACTNEELFQEMKAHQNTNEPRTKLLIDCLISAQDYEHFYRIAHREGLKYHLPCGNPKCGTCALREGRPLPTAETIRIGGGAKEYSDSKSDYDEYDRRGNDSKADSKGCSPSSRNSKGTVDDDDNSGAK